MNDDYDIQDQLDRFENCIMISLLAFVLLAGVVVCLYAQSIELKGRVEILERMAVQR